MVDSTEVYVVLIDVWILETTSSRLVLKLETVDIEDELEVDTDSDPDARCSNDDDAL